MKKTRTQKLVKNTFFSLSMEFIKLACGLILPRLILSNYGSEYNGITQSIAQFISYVALMKAGIGGATKAALYKPLAEKNEDEISEIIAATEIFMRKIAFAFIVFVCIFASVYPFLIKEEFDWLFTFTLVLIIALSTFAEYYFGFTYHTLLEADQKDYIYSILSIISVIMNTILSVILINANCSIHIVKLGSSISAIIIPIYLYIYCHKKYNLKKIKTPKTDSLSQRWDAFSHEVASFVNHNTDIVVLTLLTNLYEVSVYTVYHYVVLNLKKIVMSFIGGFGVAFGDMHARSEDEAMHRNLRLLELVLYSFVSTIYSTALVMIIPFVMLYTRGVIDINYKRVLFSIIIIIAGMFDCFRFPYRQIIINTGHFKETKKSAYYEATINIGVSVIMVFKYGLIGVAIGTLCAMIYGTAKYSIYVSKNIIKRSNFETVIRIISTTGIVFVVYGLSNLYIGDVDSYLTWFVYAVVTGTISLIITVIFNYVCYNKYFMIFIGRLKRMITKG